MKLEFQPISSVLDAEEWLPFVEMLALFNGSCAIDDLEWDDDPLLRSFIDETVDPALRSDYEAERVAGIQWAKDRFISDLTELILERGALLGDSYPFDVINDGAVLIKLKVVSRISEAGLAYLWLALFWTVSSQSDYLIISADDHKKFIRDFPKVFEYICCMVIATRAPAAVWYFGDSRDVKEFLRRLQKVVNAVGNGGVKTFEQLQQNQTGANDAGVDVLAIPTHQGVIPQNGTAYLLGATIQRTDRTNKIVGHDQITRYREYFLAGPKLAYQGVLAIPFEGTEIDALNCRDKNCGYITKSDILKILADYPVGSSRLTDIRSARLKIRRESRAMKNVAVLVGRSGNLTIAWE